MHRLADGAGDLLRADKDAAYDQVITINLDELKPHANGPFTPDLGNPVDQLGANAKKNGTLIPRSATADDRMRVELRCGAWIRSAVCVLRCCHPRALFTPSPFTMLLSRLAVGGQRGLDRLLHQLVV